MATKATANSRRGAGGGTAAGGGAGGFLQALIRGVKPSSRQQAAAAAAADAENANVLTRAAKRRLSSEVSAAAAAAAAKDAKGGKAGIGTELQRKALNSLSNVQQQQQQKQRRGSKRLSKDAAKSTSGAVLKRSRRAAAAAAGSDESSGLKLSQESNLGLGGLFASQEANSKPVEPPIPVELCRELASRDSVLACVDTKCRYLDHYPYALESFFLDQDLEEVYRRDLPLLDFLQPQLQSKSLGALPSTLRWDMLRVLFDWLVNAHESLELNYETLYLTVKLIYMYLSRRGGSLPRQSLQLLAIAALWIASKKEELFAVQLRQLTYLTLDEYSPRQVMSMEQQILSAIDFRINWPLAYNFLRRYLRVIDHTNQPMCYLARYLLELSLLDHQLNLERESAKAAAALWLARAQLGMRPLWPQHLRYSTAWTQAELLPLARRLNDMSAGQQQLRRQHQQAAAAPSFGGGVGGTGVDGSGGPQSTTFLKYSNAIFNKVALTPALPADSEVLRG